MLSADNNQHNMSLKLLKILTVSSFTLGLISCDGGDSPTSIIGEDSSDNGDSDNSATSSLEAGDRIIISVNNSSTNNTFVTEILSPSELKYDFESDVANVDLGVLPYTFEESNDIGILSFSPNSLSDSDSLTAINNLIADNNLSDLDSDQLQLTIINSLDDVVIEGSSNGFFLVEEVVITTGVTNSLRLQGSEFSINDNGVATFTGIEIDEFSDEGDLTFTFE